MHIVSQWNNLHEMPNLFPGKIKEIVFREK